MQKILELIKKYEEIINYLIVGALTTLISLITYYGLTFTILNPYNNLELQIANIISWIVGVTFAFFTNKKYVFKSKNKNTITEAYKFVGARVASLIVDMLFMFVMVSILQIDDKISKLIVQIIVIIINYIFSKFFVFKKNTRRIKND